MGFTRMQIAFFGTSEFAVPILEALAKSQWRPSLVITTPDAPAGRSKILRPPPVKSAAERLGIPVVQPAELSPIPPALSAELFDLFIVAAYGKILPPELLIIPKHGALNVHPSLLPHWRGPSPIQYTILNGDADTGVTIILMDEKVDHGPIIRNAKFKIQNSKLTTPELTEQLAKIGADLLLKAIPEWLGGTIELEPQNELQATYAPKLKREDGHIDWSRPALELERMVRAFNPWPGAYAFWQKNGDRVRLAVESTEAKGQKSKVKGLVGTVFEHDGALGVQTGDGVLAIERLRPEGKKSMHVQEFLRGHPAIVGAVLT